MGTPPSAWKRADLMTAATAAIRTRASNCDFADLKIRVPPLSRNVRLTDDGMVEVLDDCDAFLLRDSFTLKSIAPTNGILQARLASAMHEAAAAGLARAIVEAAQTAGLGDVTPMGRTRTENKDTTTYVDFSYGRIGIPQPSMIGEIAITQTRRSAKERLENLAQGLPRLRSAWLMNIEFTGQKRRVHPGPDFLTELVIFGVQPVDRALVVISQPVIWTPGQPVLHPLSFNAFRLGSDTIVNLTISTQSLLRLFETIYIFHQHLGVSPPQFPPIMNPASPLAGETWQADIAMEESPSEDESSEEACEEENPAQ